MRHDGAGAWDASPPDRVAPLIDVADLPNIFWETSNDLLVVTDEDTVVRATNPAWQRALGWMVEQGVVRVADLVHDDDRHIVQETLAGRSEGRRIEGLELRLRTVWGDYRDVLWSGLWDGTSWYASGRDVTDVRRSEQTARDAAAFWQATIDSMQGTVAVLDDLGRIVAVNKAWRDLGRRHERTGSSELGRNYLDMCDRAGDEPGARQAAAGVRALLAGRRDPVVFDYPLNDRWVSFTATAFVGEGMARIVISQIDVTARRLLEQDALAQAGVLDQFEIAVFGQDRDHRVTRWSEGAERLLGWSRSEALGRSMLDMVDPRSLTHVEDGPSAVEGRYELSRKDGTTFAAHLRWTEVRDSEGQLTGAMGVAMDVSAQERAQAEAGAARNYLRTVTDSMTEGLFALGPDGGVTTMNQAAEQMLGWSLDEVRGERLHDITRHRRFDGQAHSSAECLMDASGDTGAHRVIDEVFVRRNGLTLPVSYTVTPLETPDGDDGFVVVFMDATHVQAEQQRQQLEINAAVWIQRVKDALAEDRFLLYAQPIVDLSTMAMTQQELLLRVLEKDGTISSPGEYLATAEQYGLTGDVDRWAIHEAIELAAAGNAVEVNVSAASVGDEDLLSDVERWLRDSQADPSLLVFEITETAVVADEQAGRRFVDHLHRLGCKVALDDFGTGYSGFAYLKQLPVDYVKIDIEFVRDLCSNSASRHVVEAVVNLARGFGFTTVAEGVEDVETLELLMSLGVHHAQGFHLGRPAPLRPDLATETVEVHR